MKNMDALLDATGQMLLHSTWQIALIGLVLALALPHVQRPEHRYWAAYSALMTAAMAGLATFLYYYGIASGPPPPAPAPLPLMEANNAVMALPPQTSPIPTIGPVSQSLYWLARYRDYLLLAWGLGFGFLWLRLIGGFWLLRRLRRTALALPFSVQDLDKLAAHTGIKRSVKIMQSLSVQTPVAFGWLKPIVLLPVALCNQLPPAEIEALVMHELAHIARRDWPMQLLQRLVETVFYFHPVVWWCASVIDHEREQSTDARVMAQLPTHRLVYARALLHVQEIQLALCQTPTLALAANGHAPSLFFGLKKRSLLLERIQIILLQHSQQKKSMIMERTFISGLLMAILVVWGLVANPTISSTVLASANGFLEDYAPFQREFSPSDTLPPAKKGVHRILHEDDKRKVDLEIKDGKVTNLVVDGRTIPSKDYEKYKELIDELKYAHVPLPPMAPMAAMAPMAPMAAMPPMAPMAAMPSMAAPPPPPPAPYQRDQNYKIRIDPSGIASLWINDGKNTVVNVDRKEKTAYHNGRKLSDDEFKWLTGTTLGKFLADLEQHDKDMRQHELDMQQHERDMEVHKAEMREHEREMEQHTRDMAQHDIDMQQHEQDMRQHELDMQQHARDMEQHARDMAVHEAEMRKVAAFQDACISQMKADGIIQSSKGLKFSLSEDAFKVNGKKQSDDLHRKYLVLYKNFTGNDLKNGTYMYNH
jgi:bla regulator protein blaR1